MTDRLGTFEVTLRLPADAIDAFSDTIAYALDTMPGVIGPMTTANRDTGEVTVSFGLRASGHPDSDVARGFELLGTALDVVSQRNGGAAPGLSFPLIEKVERQTLALT